MKRRTGYPLNSSRLLKNCGRAKAYEMATRSPNFHFPTAKTASPSFLESPEACFYCGQTECLLTDDHRLPRSRGGPDDSSNIVRACRACNQKKGTKTAEEYLASRSKSVIQEEAHL